MDEQHILTPDEAIRDLVLADCARRGLSVTARRTSRGYALAVNGRRALINLSEITQIARAQPPDTWPDLAARLVRVYETAPAALDDLGDLSHGVQDTIRTRLLPVPDSAVDLSYARAFAPGLTVGLCLSLTDMVVTVDAAFLPLLGLPPEELFDLGQRNTDADPIDHMEVAHDAWFMSGASLFTASKAAHMAAVVAEHMGDAPLGVVFAVPDRHTLIAARLTRRSWYSQVDSLAEVVPEGCFDPRVPHPGGVISASLFYWSPDGAIERLTEPGGPRPAMFPGPAFRRHVLES
jgi:hypothetical protein